MSDFDFMVVCETDRDAKLNFLFFFQRVCSKTDFDFLLLKICTVLQFQKVFFYFLCHLIDKWSEHEMEIKN